MDSSFIPWDSCSTGKFCKTGESECWIYALVLLIITSVVNLSTWPNISKPQMPHLQNSFLNLCWEKNHLLILFSVILTQSRVILGETVSGEVVSGVHWNVILFVVPCRSWLDSRRKSGGSDPAPKSGCCYSEFLFCCKDSVCVFYFSDFFLVS